MNCSNTQSPLKPLDDHDISNAILSADAIIVFQILAEGLMAVAGK